MENEELNPEDNSNETWPTWAIDRAPQGLARRHKLFSQFAKWMAINVKDLWAGKSGFELSAIEHQSALGTLLNISRNSNDRRILSHWWESLVASGNKTGIWKITFPSREVVLPAVTPAFVHQDFQLLKLYRPIEESFIRLVCDNLNSNQLADAALCAAVFFGGIVSIRRLKALCALRSSDLTGDGKLLWAKLQNPDDNKYTSSTRWYPDALTGTLFIRLKESELWTSSLANSDKSDILLNALHRLGITAWPKTWSQLDLIRAVQVALSLDHMGIVTSYLCGRFETFSLPETGLHRIAKWAIIDETDSGTPSDIPPIALFDGAHAHAATFTPEVMFSSQREIARKIASRLENHQQAYSNLTLLQKEYAEQMWPVTYYLVEWAKWRLRPTTGEKGIRPVSVLRYFRPLVNSLIYEAESEDLLSLDVEEFETLYELTTARVAGMVERARVWTTLRSFHDFMFFCGVPDIDFRELDGYTSEQGQGSVSANLVTEAEFGRFKSVFFQNNQSLNSLHQHRVFFAGMLGFRTGLRRREVQMLQIRDYHPGHEPFLLIRPSKFATLKSHSSIRRIPLKALLPPDEFLAFVSYMDLRRDTLEKLSDFIFAENHTPDTPPLQSKLIDPVTDTFQIICGKGRSNFCFHHLRHSFSNWLFLTLLASDQPELLAERPQYIDSALLQDNQIQTIRDSLFPRLAGTPASPDRRHLYQVAALMGHLSPITTLRSYIHLLDWVAMRSLDMALANKFDELEIPALGRICGLSPSAPYKSPYRDLAGQPTKFLREYIRVHGKLKKEYAEIKAELTEDLLKLQESLKIPALPDLRLLMTLVSRRMQLDNSLSLARNFSVSSTTIDAIHSAYRRMYAKQSVLHEKATLSPPAFPRAMNDRVEFWRIIEATEHSYKIEENRRALSLAADCLIRRTGPRTGKLYFSKHIEDAPDIARGILLIGIEPDQVKLVLRKVSSKNSVDPDLISITNQIRNIGIEIVSEPLDWKIRSKKSDLMRLEISITNLPAKSSWDRSEGRVRGINYAALWVLFANLLLVPQMSE